jgi:tetratricopeptide (TPR) repeat protein
VTGNWTIVELEPALAARSGLPERLAVPVEVVAAQEPLDRERAATWSARFAQEHPEHPLHGPLAALAEAEPFRRLGERLLTAGRTEEAIVALARAIDLAPFDAASRFNRALALRREGRLEEALVGLDEVEWAYSGEYIYLVTRGGVLESLDEPERAVVEYERALVVQPGDERVLERLEALGALVRLDGPDGEPYWLTPADYDRVMRHELAANAANPRALVAQGEALAHAGRWDLARSAAELALHSDDARADAWALAGRARLALEQPGSREALERAAQLDGSRVDVARALVEHPDDPEGDLVRAEIHARRHAGSAAAWLVLGDALARAGSDEDAVAAFQQALALDPLLPDAAHARDAVERALRS